MCSAIGSGRAKEVEERRISAHRTGSKSQRTAPEVPSIDGRGRAALERRASIARECAVWGSAVPLALDDREQRFARGDEFVSGAPHRPMTVAGARRCPGTDVENGRTATDGRADRIARSGPVAAGSRSPIFRSHGTPLRRCAHPDRSRPRRSSPDGIPCARPDRRCPCRRQQGPRHGSHRDGPRKRDSSVPIDMDRTRIGASPMRDCSVSTPTNHMVARRAHPRPRGCSTVSAPSTNTRALHS